MLFHGRFRPRSKVLHIPTTAQLADLKDQFAKYKKVLARMNITSFQPFTQRQIFSFEYIIDLSSTYDHASLVGVQASNDQYAWASFDKSLDNLLWPESSVRFE